MTQFKSLTLMEVNQSISELVTHSVSVRLVGLSSDVSDLTARGIRGMKNAYFLLLYMKSRYSSTTQDPHGEWHG
jgi:hypothetical protein